MRALFLTIICIIFSLSFAIPGQIEPVTGTSNIVGDLKSAVNKMREILVQAPESNLQGELENDIQKVSNIFKNKRLLLIQSSDDIEEDNDEEEDESKDLSQGSENQEDTPTPEAEELLKQLTTKIWKTTDEILRAHTGIS
ncbi:uncharacterized protein cubi_03542 [Cryptosporidium ubiquitum]|uniref:Secreted protein n=1 Tax=Cryptosporidium ubiquitum TaxID=857276 RepID=A0A1J4MHQ8_9CRYT|nr:uncharacterized protein cubi_03542 [Cryptosporidium ubiquitum]OII73744.1 hypothetical protein cubi_03542 [Cryptosporidium ubiquitum]